MDKLVELLWFVFACYGFTYLVVYANIFNKIRPAKEWLYGFGKLFHCPLCFGFHAGYLFCLVSSGSRLFTFEANITDMFICACVSAGTTYLLSMIVDDEGINLNVKENK